MKGMRRLIDAVFGVAPAEKSAQSFGSSGREKTMDSRQIEEAALACGWPVVTGRDGVAQDENELAAMVGRRNGPSGRLLLQLEGPARKKYRG